MERDKEVGLALIEANTCLNQREQEEGLLVLSSRPRNAWLALTGRCNLRCLHCPRGLERETGRKASDLPEELFGKLERELFPFMERCVLGGNNLGEPLMAERFDEFLERMARFGMRLEFISNATLLNPERGEKMVESQAVFLISVEGVGDTYERIRGKPWAQVLKAIKALDQERKAHGPRNKTLIILGMTAFRDNIEQLRGLVELKSLGVDELMVHHLSPCREEHRYQSLVYDRSLGNEIFDQARSRAEELGLKLHLPENFPLKALDELAGDSSWSGQKASFKACSLPWQSVSIDEEGRVMPCCASQMLMGDLKGASFMEVWNSSRYQRLRATVNSEKPLEDCRSCPLRLDNAEAALLKGISLGPSDQLSLKSLLVKRVKERLLRTQNAYLLQVARGAYRRLRDW